MMRDDDDDDEADDHAPLELPRTAVTTLVYKRGEAVVERKWKGKWAHAGVGTIWVEGHSFDSFERLDGYVALKEGRYVCKMETSPNPERTMTYVRGGKKITERRKQIRPLNHGTYRRGGGLARILIHPGKHPTSFIGCIGVGRRHGNELWKSVECMLLLLDLCGGYKRGKQVHLVVEGKRPATPDKT